MLLIIDDDPSRYDYLVKLIEGKVEYLIVSCKNCIKNNIGNANSILLDYDLNGYDLCPNCDSEVTYNASQIVYLIPELTPVIITSCSRPENRMWLYNTLKGNRPITIISADHIGCELEWLGQLWNWEVLEKKLKISYVLVILYYVIENSGDGSVYLRWFTNEKIAKEYEDSFIDEKWGEPSMRSIESFIGSKIHTEAIRNDSNYLYLIDDNCNHN